MEELKFKVVHVPTVRVEIEEDKWVNFWSIINLLEELQNSCMLEPIVNYNEDIEEYLHRQGLVNRSSLGIYIRDHQAVEDFMNAIDEQRVKAIRKLMPRD